MAAPKKKDEEKKTKYDPTQESKVELDESDKKLLEKIKDRYGDKLDKVYPYVIQNFITGYKHFSAKDETGEAREKETFMRLDHYFDRFEKYKFDTCLDEKLENEEEMMKAWRIFTYGYDHQGHPVLYDEIGSADTAAVDKAFNNDIESLRKYRYRFHRRLANCKRIQSEKLDTPVYKHLFVMDLKGFSSSHFGSNYRNTVKEIIGDEQNVFPETLYKMFLINTPWAFRLIWKIVGNFIDPITYDKIKVLSTDYIGELSKYVDIESIPKEYGGKGKIPIKYGYCSDLPHDRYPLDYYDKYKDSQKKPNVNDNGKNDEDYKDANKQ